MERIVQAVAPGACLAPAHRCDVDVVGRIGVGVETDHLVEPAQDQRLGRVARVVEDLDRHQCRLRRDAHHPDPVHRRCRGAGDVRAVAVAVVGRQRRIDAVLAAGHVDVRGQVRMGEIDAGVDDRDAGRRAPVARLIGTAG